MKQQFLVTIEFRYSDAPDSIDSTHRTKTITVGVYDTIEEACEGGNKELVHFEDRFPLNPNYNRKERFSTNGGCFGSAHNLISPLAYLSKVPFDFYAKITTLNYGSISDTIDEVVESVERYRAYKIEDDIL